MKGQATYLLTALLMLAGCTIDKPLDYDPDLRLMFQPAMFMLISHDGIDRFPSGQSIGVAAWTLPEGAEWSEDGSKAEVLFPLSEASAMQVPITDSASREEVLDTLWGLEGQIYWPKKDRRLTFMAFSPYEAGCTCDIRDGIGWSTDVLQDQTDLLYTAPHADIRKTDDGWVVPLMFEHALARMEFRIKHRVAEDEKITVRSITVDAMRHQGQFRSLGTPQWTLGDGVEPFVFFEGLAEAEPLPQQIGDYWMVIPQELDTFVTVEYEYTTFANTSITQRLRTVPLMTVIKPGRNYTYTLTIGIDDVKFMEELIEDDEENNI